MYTLPTPVVLNIERDKADEALKEYNELYAKRDALSQTQRTNLEKLLDKLCPEDDDLRERWLNVEWSYAVIRITPGDRLDHALRILRNPETQK